MGQYALGAAAPASQKRISLAGLVRPLEVALVLMTAVVVIFAERFPPQVVIVALALLALPFLLRLFIFGQLTTPTLANVPIGVFLLLLIVTCWVTPAWQYTFPEMARMVWGMALFLAIINWINPLPLSASVGAGGIASVRDASYIRLLVATVAYLGLGVALTTIGLLGIQPTYKIEFLGLLLQSLPDVHFRGIDSFNSNNVAGVIVLFAPLAVALAIGPLQLRQRSWATWLLVKIPALLLAFYFSSALLLTQTRGAWLAFACSVALMLVLIGRRGWLLLALLVVVASTGVYLIGPSTLLDQLTVRSSQGETQGGAQVGILQDRNLSARFVLWQRALHGMADAPLTGMGLGAFEAVSQQPYPQVEGFTPDADMTHVHNLILQAGVDFGVAGVLALVVLLMLTASLLMTLLRRTPASTSLHTWGIGVCGSFVAFLIYNMTNATTLGSTTAVAPWFLLGLCVAGGELVKRQLHSRQGFAVGVGSSGAEAESSESSWSEWEDRAWAVTSGAEKQ